MSQEIKIKIPCMMVNDVVNWPIISFKDGKTKSRHMDFLIWLDRQKKSDPEKKNYNQGK